jgi:hypothetical protein
MFNLLKIWLSIYIHTLTPTFKYIFDPLPLKFLAQSLATTMCKLTIIGPVNCTCLDSILVFVFFK